MKKALWMILPLLVLLLCLPFVNGLLAEREIKGLFKRSLVGEEAVKSYERGYLTSNCLIEFSARDLLRGDLSEQELGEWEGVLTQFVMRTSFSVYHCPSLKDRTIYCKGEGQTVIKAPGDLAKAVDLKASLGWDACVRASFRIPGGKVDRRLLELLFPGTPLAQIADCEVADVVGRVEIPLSGSQTSLECRALGMGLQEGGFSNFVLRGASRLVAENVRAYSFTGDLEKVEGGTFSASKGKIILNGVVSNDLHNLVLSLNSETKIAERSLPLDFRIDLANCDLKKLNEMRRGFASLNQKRAKGFDLSLISRLAEALESGKEFLGAKPNLGCRGTVKLPEGPTDLKFRFDTARVKLNSWRDVFRLGENLEGGFDLAVPKAALEEGGTLSELFGYSQRIPLEMAAESNGYLVIHVTLKELLTR